MSTKKKKAGFLLIKGETFPYDTIVALGATREELLAYMEKNFVNALTEADKEALHMVGHGRTLRCDNNAFICWTRVFPQAVDDYGHLAHEIFHTADLILRKAGATLSDDSDEVWAYHVDWLTRRIYSAFKLV